MCNLVFAAAENDSNDDEREEIDGVAPFFKRAFMKCYEMLRNVTTCYVMLRNSLRNVT